MTKYGRFLTKTPKIQKWDRIFVRITDRNGDIKESVFHVKTIKKKRKKGKGLQLELFCPHQSSNRLTVKVSKPNIRSSGAEALEDALNQVNDPINRGANDPEIIITTPFDKDNKLGNRLDVTIANNYVHEFVPLQKAIDDIIKKEGNVVTGGGAFQFHYFRFVSLYNHSTHSDLDKIGIQVFEQGYKKNPATAQFENVPTVTLKKERLQDQIRGNVLELDTNEESELGTNLIAVGEKGSGSYPKETAIFQGEKDAFFLVKEWADNLNYKTNQRVKYNGSYYKSNLDHTSNLGVNDPVNGLGVFWTGPQSFVPSVDYSIMTKDKAQYWINSLAGAKYAATPGGRTCMVDMNCVIRDPKHNRLYADCVENSSANVLAKTDLMKNGLPYDGFKVLVTNPSTGTSSGLAGDFVGNDKNGVAYSQNLVEFQDPVGDQVSGEWVVIRETETDDEIVDWEECLSWTFDRCSGLLVNGSPKDSCTLGSRNGIWTKGSYGFLDDVAGIGVGAQFRAGTSIAEQFDCFHPVKRNGSGVVEVGNEKISSDDTSGTSAVFINFAPQESAGAGKTSVAGFNFDMLFPKSGNGIPFGVVNIGERMGLEVFDMNNMHRNSKGTRTWFGEDVIDFFPIQGWKFWMLLQDLLPGGIGNFVTPGNYNMALWLMDRSFNKIIIDFVHGAEGKILPADVPLGKRKSQRSVQGIKTFVQSQNPEDNTIFDIRNVVKGGVITKDSYDNQWKYISATNVILSVGTSNNRFFNTEKIHLAWDYWRMTKPLVATNVRDASKPTRNIMPQILKHEEIVSQSQLQNLVDSEELIHNFEPKEIIVDRPARNNIKFGDPVYYTDEEAIDETTDGLPNTVKAVMDKEIITCSKPTKGPGGMTSKVYLKTRLFP